MVFAWGKAMNAYLNTVFMFDYSSHSDPLFACSNSTDKNASLFQLIASLLHDIQNHRAPPNICKLFTHSEHVHSYSTRFSVAGSFYIKQVKTNHQLLSFSRVGTKYGMASPSTS